MGTAQTVRHSRAPWNQGKLVDQKAPFKPKSSPGAGMGREVQVRSGSSASASGPEWPASVSSPSQT